MEATTTDYQLRRVVGRFEHDENESNLFPMLPISRGVLPYLKVIGFDRSCFRLEQHEDEMSKNLRGMVLTDGQKR